MEWSEAVSHAVDSVLLVFGACVVIWGIGCFVGFVGNFVAKRSK